MKRMRTVAVLIMITLAFTMVTSCSSIPSETTKPQTVATTTKDPIESLGRTERVIFDAFVLNIDKFYNPQSIRILEVKGTA